MKILNRHHLKKTGWPEGAVYVGRGTVLGNPFVIDKDGTREEVIEKYRGWLGERIASRDVAVLTALAGLKHASALVCSCAPAPCHAEVVADRAVEIDLPPHCPSHCYAGIGSRATPPEVLELMQRIAGRLAERGYTLRSGGAVGADIAFQAGAGAAAQIFLPWAGFNGQRSPFTKPSDEAYRVASVTHPAYKRLSESIKALQARNCHQVLGPDLNAPSDFVVCWTEDGCESESGRSFRTGGTGQAIALADRWGIPVFNLANPGALDRIAEFLKGER